MIDQTLARSVELGHLREWHYDAKTGDLHVHVTQEGEPSGRHLVFHTEAEMVAFCSGLLAAS